MAKLDSNQVNQTRMLLEGAKSILIAISANPTLDNVASGLALYLALSTAGKQVSLVCPTPMTVELNHLIGVDKIASSVNSGSGRNLVISFPYEEGSIEKVSYNIENDTFNLVIEPREGFSQITQEMMRYTYSGGNTDIIVTLGIAKMFDLDHFYSANQNFFNEKTIINIDINQQNTNFGKVNLVDSSVSCTSELMTTLISQLGLTYQEDIATNLLTGLTDGSSNFASAATTAMTFEAAAICLKNGARKPGSTSPRPSVSPFPSPQYQSASNNPAQSPPSAPPAFDKSARMPYPKQPSSQPSPVISGPFKGRSQPPKSIPPQNTAPMKESTHPETPPDWLKPKIYKGSTLL